MHLVFPRDRSNRFDHHKGFQSQLGIENTCIPFPFDLANSAAVLSGPAEPEKSNLATGPNFGIHFFPPGRGRSPASPPMVYSSPSPPTTRAWTPRSRIGSQPRASGKAPGRYATDGCAPGLSPPRLGSKREVVVRPSDSQARSCRLAAGWCRKGKLDGIREVQRGGKLGPVEASLPDSDATTLGGDAPLGQPPGYLH